MSERLLNPGRCPICDWPLAESRDKGCVADDCSYRPEQGSAEYRRIHRRRAALAVLRERAAHNDALMDEFEAAAPQRDMQEVGG